MTTTADTLWDAYRRERSIRNRNALVVRYLDQVRIHAARLSRRLPTQLSYDDIYSAAVDGLIEAVEAYDPNRAARFETFCGKRIVGAVMDWLRETDPLDRTVRQFVRGRAKIVQAERVKQDAPPCEEAIRERMGLSARRYRVLAEWARRGQVTHLGNLVSDEPGSHEVVSFPDPRAPDPGDRSEAACFRAYILRGLSRAERLVLVLRYYEDMRHVEIARVLGVSESRVSQVHDEILAHLRWRMAGRVGLEFRRAVMPESAGAA
jgi:RNA polymerase sigma factor for flagellar operon FliA